MNEQQQPKPSTPGSHGDQQTASGERNIQANASTVSVTSEQGDTVGGNKFIIEKAYFGPPPDNTPKLTEALKLLDSLPLDGVPAPAPLPTPHRMPLGRNPLFVGREADLRALAATLKGGTTAAIGQVAAATGLGGIGKTQLAAEFVHRYGHFFAGGVFWLSFADAQAVAGEMVAAGATLDLPSFSTLKFEDQLARVRQVWREPIPRLLVFDNCEDEKLLEEWRPLTGGCRILVTSRRASWDPVLGVTVRALDVLPRDQSVALLRQFRPDLPADDTDLAAIAAELGDLPLALHLAGSFLRLNRFDMSPADYLAELRTTALLEHPSLHQTDQTRSATNHPLHVRRTLALSYDQLDTNEPADALARLLLLHASHFALGEPLPRDLVRASLGAQASGSPFSDAVRRLVELGLVDELSNGSMRMHRLIGALVCPPTPDAAIAEAVEQIVLERARQLHEQGSPAAMLPILPHLHTVAERATKRDDAQAISLWLALGQYLEEAGRYSDARAAYEQALGIQRALFGEQHTVTASCLNALGEVLWRQSEYLAAQTALESALAIRRALLNDNHPETARTLNSLVVRQGYLE